jgi:hypothetical protein
MDGIHIVDCETEAIDGDVAEVHADAAGTYTVYVRILVPTPARIRYPSAGRTRRPETVAVHDKAVQLGTITLGRAAVSALDLPASSLTPSIAALAPQTQGTNFRIAEVRLPRP